MRDVFHYLVLSSARRLRNQSLFAILSGAVSIYGDLLKPIAHAMAIGTLICAVTIAVVIGAIGRFARSEGPLTTIPKGSSRRVLSPRIPYKVKRLHDIAEFAAICITVFLVIWGGQHILSKRTGTSVDSVSVFATLVPPLERLRSEVNGVRSEVSGMRRDLRSVAATLGGVKKEVSDDPRKELANIGIAWSGETFLEAVRVGDLRVVRLFIAGGLPISSATSQGRPLPVMLALNNDNPEEMVETLVAAGLDINRSYELASGIGRVKLSLMSRAIEKGNVPLAKALIRHHADLNSGIQTFGRLGAAKESFPLASAVSWQQFEIASLLLDAGADPGAGDFAAYREAQTQLTVTGNNAARQRLETLNARLAPQGPAAERIHDQLRLEAVERQLNDVALQSIRTPNGTSAKFSLGRQYNELQRERALLQSRLGMPLPARR